MKIYTKKGDLGRTSLFGGLSVEKFDDRVDSYGEIDELMSSLGVASSFSEDSELVSLIESIQTELFFMSSELATPSGQTNKSQRIESTHVHRLEKEIDRCDKELPALRSFILPGGTQSSAMLHLTRSICRRAERRIVFLATKEKIRPEVLQYINRLSDLLFNLGRQANFRANRSEIKLSELNKVV